MYLEGCHDNFKGCKRDERLCRSSIDSRDLLNSDSLRSLKDTGSLLKSWLLLKAVVGGSLLTLFFSAFGVPSVFCIPCGHLQLQAHTRPLMCSRLGNMHTTIKTSGRPAKRKESITHLIGCNDFFSPAERPFRNEGAFTVCGLVWLLRE